MKIKELHPDIKRYLEEDCYCSYEIYSIDGFFYQIFKPDYECEKIDENDQWIACVSSALDDGSDIQILLFTKEDNKIIDAIRYDATDNNIKAIKCFIKKGLEETKKMGLSIDEYEEGTKEKSIKEILAFCDAVMVDIGK